MLTPSTYVRLVACTLFVVAGACGGDGGLTVPPTTGTLEITTATTGTEPDPDGYSLVIDAAAPSTIGASATMTASDVAPGSHTVQLIGIATNCAVAGDNPQSVTVTAGEVSRVSFAITCNATTGSLSVSAPTSGPSPDPDGYTITVDGIDRGALAVNASVTLSDLAPGSHAVGLSGLAANCQIQGENPRTITTTAGGNEAVEFAVSCAVPPANAGTLRVTTATSGPDADPDGYTFAVDGGASQPIGVSATATLANTAPGTHSIQLAGIASNCTVQGVNPRSVTVTGGGAVDASFTISCSATSGAIRINVTTSGSPTDPDGYVAKLDGAEPGKPVATSGNVSFTGVPAGSHSVALSGVATNCSVTDGTSRTVSVTVGATAEVNLAVTCAAATGSIKVTTATGGSAVDADGYTVSVDGGAAQSIGNNATITISNIAPGNRSVALGGTAPNCTVSDANPRTVAVTAGAEAPVSFTVTCTPSAATRWTTNPLPSGFVASALWASSPSDIFVVGLDESAPSTAPRRVLHYDGHAWAEQLRGRDWWESPRALWGRSATDLFAAGGTHVWHYDGSEWRPIWDGFSTANYQSIWGASPQNLFAGGWDDGTTPSTGAIDHYDGTAWSRMAGHGFGSTNGSVYDIAGTSPSDVYALGSVTSANDTPPEFAFTNYRVAHYDGNGWTLSFESRVPAGPGDFFSLSGVWAVAENDVFLVGSGGHIFRFNGTQWSPMTSPTTENLQDVWGNAGTNVYAVGDPGILRYDGTSWRVIEATAGIRVWGAGSDVFVIRKDGGAILHGTP